MLSGEGVSNGSATDCKDEDGDSNDLSDAHFNFYNKNIFFGIYIILESKITGRRFTFESKSENCVKT